jgi:hypothetical protein
LAHAQRTIQRHVVRDPPLRRVAANVHHTTHAQPRRPSLLATRPPSSQTTAVATTRPAAPCPALTTAASALNTSRAPLARIPPPSRAYNRAASTPSAPTASLSQAASSSTKYATINTSAVQARLQRMKEAAAPPSTTAQPVPSGKHPPPTRNHPWHIVLLLASSLPDLHACTYRQSGG